MFGSQPVFAAENHHRFAGPARFASHRNRISGDDDAVGASVKAHNRVFFLFAPQVSVSRDVGKFFHDDVFGGFSGPARRRNQDRTADLIVNFQNGIGQHFGVFIGKRLVFDGAADQYGRQGFGQRGKGRSPFLAGFFKGPGRNTMRASGNVKQIFTFGFAAVVFRNNDQIHFRGAEFAGKHQLNDFGFSF